MLMSLLTAPLSPGTKTAEVRMPNAELYNPLARLWQLEELDGYIESRKEAFDTIEQHRCKRTTEAIVDGTREPGYVMSAPLPTGSWLL